MTDEKLKQAITAIGIILKQHPYPAGFAFSGEPSSDGLGLIVRDLKTQDWTELRRV